MVKGIKKMPQDGGERRLIEVWRRGCEPRGVAEGMAEKEQERTEIHSGYGSLKGNHCNVA